MKKNTEIEKDCRCANASCGCAAQSAERCSCGDACACTRTCRCGSDCQCPTAS